MRQISELFGSWELYFGFICNWFDMTCALNTFRVVKKKTGDERR